MDRLAQTAEKGHGRAEARRIRATTRLNEYLGWPGVRQAGGAERTRRVGRADWGSVAVPWGSHILVSGEKGLQKVFPKGSAEFPYAKLGGRRTRRGGMPPGAKAGPAPRPVSMLVLGRGAK